MARKRSLPRHVRRHGTGFRAVVAVHGIRHYSGTFRTVEEATEYAHRMKRAQNLGSTITLQEGYELLMAECRAANCRQGTMNYYLSQFRAVTGHVGWDPDIPLARISAGQIRRYIQARLDNGVSPNTVSGKELQILDRILRLAVRRGSLLTNPMGQVRRPKIRAKRFQHMTAERVSEVVAAIRDNHRPGRDSLMDQRDSDIVALFFYSGIRRSECARLTAESVDWARWELHIDGKNAERVVPIAMECREVLRRLAEREVRGGELVGDARFISDVFYRWNKRLGESRLTPHVMRHSFGTALAASGATPFVIRELMGHESLQQSLRYVHSVEDQGRAAVDLLRL